MSSGSGFSGSSESLEGVDVTLSLFFGELSSLFFYSFDDSLSSESVRGDESLDFGSLGIDLSVLGGDLSLGSEFGDHKSESLSFLGVGLLFVIDFEKSEFLEDVIGSLGAESVGEGSFLGESGDRLGSNFSYFNVQNSDVRGDDATSD